MRKMFAAVLTAFALSVPAAVPAHANSAQTSWEGRDAFGAVVLEKNCPVEVERETLTLRIPEFPENGYESKEAFLRYAANVTAEYTFYNPADYDVEMTLVFPFGARPSYFPDYGTYDEEGNFRPDPFDDTAGYMITADGTEVERMLRHTYSQDGIFSLDRDLPRLSAGRMITAETPAKVYTYRLPSAGPDVFAEAEFFGTGDPVSTEVMFCGVEHRYFSGTVEDGVILKADGETFAMWVIGADLYRLPEWRVYTQEKDGETELGTAVLLSVEDAVFSDLAMKGYLPEYGVSERDWFNAVCDGFSRDADTHSMISAMSEKELDVSRSLMRWYEYRLKLPAKGRVLNAVTAPLYPTISLDYDDLVCFYTYYLSPASTWADFGAFEARIETPFYLTKEELGFQKTEYGYSFSQNGLPAGELEFALSPSENPKPTRNVGKAIGDFFLYFWWLLLIVLAGAVGLAVLLCRFVRKKKTK